jgi:hypothetical protein
MSVDQAAVMKPLDDDFARTVPSFFDNLGPNNPLKWLTSYDKRLLTSFLGAFLVGGTRKGPRGSDDPFEELEEASRVGAEAAQLAEKIQRTVFEGNVAKSLGPLLGPTDLPALLREFSKHISEMFETFVGKAGHKRKVTRTRILVLASELVRRRTGNYNDEHLAELLQAVAGETGHADDYSGDMIRKRREYLDKHYNFLYVHVLLRLNALPDVPDTVADLRWKSQSRPATLEP